MKKIIILFLFLGLTRVWCAETNEKQFDVTQLIEDAPEFSQDAPVERERPWVIRLVEKPASSILFFFCDLWDRVHAKTTQFARSAWAFVWRKRVQELVMPIYNNVSVRVISQPQRARS